MRLRTEPPYAERHARWCERAINFALLDLEKISFFLFVHSFNISAWSYTEYLQEYTTEIREIIKPGGDRYVVQVFIFSAFDKLGGMIDF